MEKKIFNFLFLSLISFMTSIKGDFLDLSGSILWRQEGQENTFLGMFEAAVSSGYYDCYATFDVDLRLTQNNGAFDEYEDWTLLMMAAHKGCYQSVEAILKAGANLQLKNPQGKTAMGIAKDKGFTEIVDLMAKYHKPKSLVDQMLESVISDLGKKEDKGKRLTDIKSILPSDLLERITSLLLEDDDIELRRLGLCLLHLDEVIEIS